MPPQSRSARSTPLHIDTLAVRATADGTARYRARFDSVFQPDYFRESLGVHASSIGIGTYLGDSTDDVDAAYQATIRHAIEHGINVIDTSINYRSQRAERVCGAAIQQAIAAGAVHRDELVVCTKGGYVPFDTTPPSSREEYQEYLKREFLDPEILLREELVAGGHSLSPRFLRYCLAKSRQNLGLRAIDVYYVHNPEQQAGAVPREEFLRRMRAAFSVLEEAATRGEIGSYGCATWDGLRVPPGTKGHLALAELVSIAKEVAGGAHHFGVIQLPLSLAMPEAVRNPTQVVDGALMTPVEAAAALGLAVMASATLMQSRLTSNLPAAIAEAFPALTKDGQRAIAFVRSLPGVTTALVGMKRADHLEENLGAAR
jgi:aryl-alcohol dehydrogenase-like predicted oxidoreductase